MKPKRVNILDMAKNGYSFVHTQRLYLMKIAMPVLIAKITTGIFLSHKIKDLSVFEIALIELPASALLAWYSFLTVRFMVFGEYANTLPPKDSPLYKRRGENLEISIIIWLLFNMFMAILTKLLNMTYLGGEEVQILPMLGFAIVPLIMLWSVRIAVLPLVVAMGVPIKDFLQHVKGLDFSFRILWLWFCCALPVGLSFAVLLSAFVSETPELNVSEQNMFIVISSPISLYITAVFNASCVGVLLQILKQKKK